MPKIIRLSSLLLAWITAFSSVLAPTGWSGANAGMLPASSAVTCSSSAGALSPCNPSQTVLAGAQGAVFIFTLKNSTATYREGGLQCSTSGHIKSCGLSTNIYELQGKATMTDTVTFSADSIVQHGSGTLVVTTGGQLGTLNTSTTITLTPLNACLAADAHSQYLIGRAQQVGTSTDQGQTTLRTATNLPLLASASQVSQITSGPTCAAASSAFDSVRNIVYATPKNPYRKVYVLQYGSLYLVGDPNVRGGEWSPMMVFSSTFSRLGDIDF